MHKNVNYSIHSGKTHRQKASIQINITNYMKRNALSQRSKFIHFMFSMSEWVHVKRQEMSRTARPEH